MDEQEGYSIWISRSDRKKLLFPITQVTSFTRQDSLCTHLVFISPEAAYCIIALHRLKSPGILCGLRIQFNEGAVGRVRFGTALELSLNFCCKAA